MLLLLLVMLAELDVLLGMLKVVVLLLVVDLLLLLPLLILCRLLLLLPLLVLNWMLLVMLLVLLLVLLLRHSRVLVTVVALVVVEVVRHRHRRVGHCHHRRRPIGGLPVPRRRRPLPPYAAVSVAVHRHDEVRVVVVARGRRHHHPVLTVAVHHAGGGRHASSSSERSSAHPTLLQGREKISHTLGRVVGGILLQQRSSAVFVQVLGKREGGKDLRKRGGANTCLSVRDLPPILQEGSSIFSLSQHRCPSRVDSSH